MSSDGKMRGPYRVRTRYDYPLIRKLYIALAEERAKQRVGRERFSDYMAEVIRQIPPRKILFSDGSEYQIPTTPPSPETIRNFLETMREASAPNGEAKALKISPTTLSYIHAFLWQLNSGRAASWDREEQLAEANLPIANLDSGFSVLAPHILFPRAIKLLQPSDATYVQTSYDMLNTEPPEEYDFSASDWTIAGVFQFEETDSALKSRFSFLSGNSWDLLIAGETGASRDALVTGVATAIKSKNLRFSTDCIPTIEDDEYIISIEVLPRRDNQPNYVGIRVEWASITLNFLEDRSLLDLMAITSNNLVFYGLDVGTRARIPVPLSRREEELLKTVVGAA